MIPLVLLRAHAAHTWAVDNANATWVLINTVVVHRHVQPVAGTSYQVPGSG